MSESSSETGIQSSVHPGYSSKVTDWEKWRYIMDGGDDFIDTYIETFSAREDDDDLAARKTISPNPAFASAALTDVRNAIFQRMADITRTGGSQTYQDMILGQLGGVDLLGATMNYFIGNEVLPELLHMGKIGVYVDMPTIASNQTMNDTGSMHPYLYTYSAEQIRNWRLSMHGEFVEYDMLLLRERILTFDDIFSLPQKDAVRYRLLTREEGVVTVRFFDEEGEQINKDGELSEEIIELGIKKIPFTIFEMNQSLLKNVANHQIALLNMESSDISYALKANFAFYVEQQHPHASKHLKTAESDTGDPRDIELGNTTGRSYAQGQNPPEFINPSSEPLLASMKKQDQLKADIRSLINLALSAIQPKYASAQAKEFDEHGLESGLSFLGLILEHGERQLASFFAEYESSQDIAIINYPDRYSLKSDAERIKEADELYSMMLKIPSKKAQKVMTKLAVRKLLETKITTDELTAILKEIDEAEYTTSDAELIHGDLEKGLVSELTASRARGYDAEKEVPQATRDHTERIKRIKEAQSNAGARGVDDLDGNPRDSARQEKEDSQNSDLQDDTRNPVKES